MAEAYLPGYREIVLIVVVIVAIIIFFMREKMIRIQRYGIKKPDNSKGGKGCSFFMAKTETGNMCCLRILSE